MSSRALLVALATAPALLLSLPVSAAQGAPNLERPHWETRVWVDGRLVGTNVSLSTPHDYDLGLLEPGWHTLTLRVDNRLVVDVGENSHSVSDHTQGNWNGIVGRIELRPTPPVWIEELHVECASWANQSTTLGDGKPVDLWVYDEADRILKSGRQPPHTLGLLFEGRVGSGRLVVCNIDLQQGLDTNPVARQFRHSLLHYMAGDRFRPSVSVTPEQVRALIPPPPTASGA